MTELEKIICAKSFIDNIDAGIATEVKKGKKQVPVRTKLNAKTKYNITNITKSFAKKAKLFVYIP